MQVVAIKRSPVWDEMPLRVALATRRWCRRHILAAPSGVDYYEASDPAVAAREIELAADESFDPALGAPCSAEVVQLPVTTDLDVARMFPDARITEVRHTTRLPQLPVGYATPRARVA